MVLDVPGGLFEQRNVYSDDGKLQVEGEQGSASRVKTQVSAVGTATAVQTTTVYTVPANKVFYLCYANLSWTSITANATDIILRKEVANWIMRMVKASGIASRSDSLCVAFTMPIKLVATDVLQIVSADANTTGAAIIWGYLEDA